MVLVYCSVFAAGALMSAMQSLNGILQGYVGLFGVSLATHVIGGVLLAGYLLSRGERIRLGPMPWYLYSAGLWGLILVAGSSFCVSRIGPALTTCVSISGQLIFSILMDHFGWMGMKKTLFQKKRAPGLLILLLGLAVVNAGGRGLGEGLTGGEGGLCLLLALALGGVNVFSKTVNFQASNHLGTVNGTLINYIVASPLSAVLLALTGGTKGIAEAFGAAPAWLYLGGVCGVAALVLNVLSLKRISLFQSTALLLGGQLAGAAILDGVLFRNMSGMKLLGVVIVAVGVIWDKKTVLTEE